MSFEADMETTITLVITAFTLWATLVGFLWFVYSKLDGKVEGVRTELRADIRHVDNKVYDVLMLLARINGVSPEEISSAITPANPSPEPETAKTSEPSTPAPEPVAVAD